MPSRKYASMLTKAELRAIKSLQEARERNATGLFVAEGGKLVSELLGHFVCRLLIGSAESLQALAGQLASLPRPYRPERVEEVAASFDWSRISGLRQPQPLLAVLEQPQSQQSLASTDQQIGITADAGLSLLLDRVQDPGNLGTIIRTSDWFGVGTIYLAPGTADPYAPKVVQATMGALARVRLVKLADAAAFLTSYPGERLGTFLGGEDLYALAPVPADKPRLVIMGNEGQGIDPALSPLVDRRITIPPYPVGSSHTESLNVAVATALLLGELRRQER